MEVIVLIAFLGGMYYVYTIVSTESAVTVPSQANQQLLGQNFVLFLKAVNQERLSLQDPSFMNSELVKQLQDFSETILPESTRGRIDPFVPYASTRPIR